MRKLGSHEERLPVVHLELRTKDALARRELLLKAVAAAKVDRGGLGLAKAAAAELVYESTVRSPREAPERGALPRPKRARAEGEAGQQRHCVLASTSRSLQKRVASPKKGKLLFATKKTRNRPPVVGRDGDDAEGAPGSRGGPPFDAEESGAIAAASFAPPIFTTRSTGKRAQPAPSPRCFRNLVGRLEPRQRRARTARRSGSRVRRLAPTRRSAPTSFAAPPRVVLSAEDNLGVPPRVT